MGVKHSGEDDQVLQALCMTWLETSGILGDTTKS